MSDEQLRDFSDYEPAAGAYARRQPLLRIAATYACSDGLIPESMEIEIDTPEMLHHDNLSAAVQALASVPANRYSNTTREAS